MVCLAIAPVLILTWTAADNTLSSVEKEIIAGSRTRVNWAGQYLEELILRFDDLFYSLQIDELIIKAVEKEADEVTILDTQKRLISAYYTHSRMIDNLDLYIHSTGEEISVNALTSGRISRPDIRSGKWTPIFNGPVSLRLEEVSGSVYALHSINTFMERRLLGGMAVRIDEDVIDFVMNILRPDDEGHVLLLNEAGELLAGSPVSILSGETLGWLDPIEYFADDVPLFRDGTSLVFAKKLYKERLTIIKTLPVEVIDASSRRILAAGLLTGGILILATVLLSILFSLQISKPIVNLARTMEETSLLDFEHLNVNRHNEVGLLEEGYNTMMMRMRDLVEKEYQREIDLRNARLNALHAQINPHFLYNTLQLIGGMAMAKNAPEIYQVSKAVGDLFRYTTASEGELVTLEKELKHIENYLVIQEMRYKGRCNVEIRIDDSVRDVLIPQFTLQPIIENAFEHGLQPKPGKWNIMVRAVKKKRGVLLLISDNGIGMESAALYRQRALLFQKNIIKNTAESHIGMKNVDTRLKLHFGKSYGLKIFSTPGQGSRIVIRLPE